MFSEGRRGIRHVHSSAVVCKTVVELNEANEGVRHDHVAGVDDSLDLVSSKHAALDWPSVSPIVRCGRRGHDAGGEEESLGERVETAEGILFSTHMAVYI